MECLCIFKNQGPGAFNNRPIICYVSFFDRKYVEHIFTGNLMTLQALLRSRCFLGCVCMYRIVIKVTKAHTLMSPLFKLILHLGTTNTGMMLRPFPSLSLSSSSVACRQGCEWNERSLNRGHESRPRLGSDATFFWDSCSNLEIDENFRISHNLGLGLAAKISQAFAIQLVISRTAII